MNRSAIIFLMIFAALAAIAAPAVATQQTVSTYHYDNLRTGWNRNETTLTPANVGSSTFGVLSEAALDDEVYAQPLVIPNQKITAGPKGRYEAVYVATEANTIYTIDAATGAVLLSRNLGTPVPRPGYCGGGGGGPHGGITGTPVINVKTQTLYVVARSLIGSTPTLQLYALNLGDLTDNIPPVMVAASHTLSDGTTLNFDATFQKSRPALLESYGNIYAAFGSICESASAHARGWLLGWHESTLAPRTLTPLPANRLTDTLAAGTFFMSSIWMSGYGIAADGAGNVFFSTGNSAPGTYDGVHDVQESVVKAGAFLVNMKGIFTPFNVTNLDKGDGDLSAGGVLLLPPQGGASPLLAVAAGKQGKMYLLNRDNLGGYTPGGPDKVLDTKVIGGCWCGPSYFTGPDNAGRVVSSGGGLQIKVWKVQTSPTIALVLEGAALPVPSGQDPGSFTTVSSDGTKAGTAIIWATGRPVGRISPAVNLYAFAAAPSSGTLPLLFSSPAGQWPDSTRNANIVPVVANGRVYVASNKLLTIFGLGGHPFAAQAAPANKPALEVQAPPHEITGDLEHVDGPLLTLRTRDDKIVRVDDSEPLRMKQTGVLVPGNAYTVEGTYDSRGMLHVQAISRAKDSPASWPPDR